jgi:hypothetical protein
MVVGARNELYRLSALASQGFVSRTPSIVLAACHTPEIRGSGFKRG